MDMLNCFILEKKLPPIKNCTEFAKNDSNFQDCLSEYKADVFDNYMLFFGQIEPICQFYNSTTPELSAQLIFKVAIAFLIFFMTIAF